MHDPVWPSQVMLMQFLLSPPENVFQICNAGGGSRPWERVGQRAARRNTHASLLSLVMSQVFLLPFRFRVRRSSLTFVRQLAICKCKEREKKENGTRLWNRNATETVSQSALNTSTSVLRQPRLSDSLRENEDFLSIFVRHLLDNRSRG